MVAYTCDISYERDGARVGQQLTHNGPPLHVGW
jgi:hypothetical protein